MKSRDILNLIYLYPILFRFYFIFEGGDRTYRPDGSRLEVRCRAARLPVGVAAKGMRRAGKREFRTLSLATRDR